MLSRAASNLHWLARYMERAENLARLIQVTQRMAAMAPGENRVGPGSEWHSALVAAGCEQGFYAKHQSADAKTVIDYLVRDPDNPSSIMRCIDVARHNARAVRISLSADMWDSVNETWIEARALTDDDFAPRRIGDVLDWVKQRSLQFNGSYTVTMLRRDGFFFTRLGTFIERADNTARLLDVKYHVLLPSVDSVGGALDYYHWTAILRAVSATRAYHVLYAGRVQPWNVAELLILHPEMPRSLMSCMAAINENLSALAAAYGGATGECHRLAGHMHAELKFGRVEAVFQTGLHEYLTAFIERNIVLGEEISRFYLM
ncbi:MAG: alpha-E domain-containing protein [Alphaproteobacteria bacterium]|nr:MAG: alpha-E domain-containing protein [Alphaproteobacteria bacterium]